MYFCLLAQKYANHKIYILFIFKNLKKSVNKMYRFKNADLIWPVL